MDHTRQKKIKFPLELFIKKDLLKFKINNWDMKNI